MYELVENMKRPLKKGEVFLTPCITREEDGKLYITPVLNYPHSDKENGQTEVHYHADFRFIKHNQGVAINQHTHHKWAITDRPIRGKDGDLNHYLLPVVNEEFEQITHPLFISKSILKNKCIHKGKCPHRGFPMDQVQEKDGILNCPLHGLAFDAKTKQLR